MLKREVRERAAAVAPFLTFDNDPYPVIREDGSIAWILDAYTTSQYYPYSEPYSFHKENVNYARNSVKVVIDAYHGDVEYYVIDPSDPVVKVWTQIYPALFKPLEVMPPDIRRHMRYGEDIFRLQAEVLLKYHVTEPSVFYNGEDQWSVADEQFLNEKRQKVVPYNIISRLPDSEKEEMMLVIPFTPTSTSNVRKENLVGWLAARMDGEHYGKLILYEFPKGELRYGTMQVESHIDQDQEMSARISLWDQAGSKVERGHLLVIPVGDAILYVEPLYLKSTTSEIPQLQKVILATQRWVNGGDRLHLVWGDTFGEALERLFAGGGAIQREKKDKLGPDETLKAVRNHLSRYRDYTAKGEYDKAGAELRELHKLLE